VPDLSQAQDGAGIASHAHSADLAAAITGPDYSSPTMEGNIIWQNRQFVFAGAAHDGAGRGGTSFGLCPTSNLAFTQPSAAPCQRLSTS